MNQDHRQALKHQMKQQMQRRTWPKKGSIWLEQFMKALSQDFSDEVLLQFVVLSTQRKHFNLTNGDYPPRSDMDIVLEKFRSKGVITEEESKSLMKMFYSEDLTNVRMCIALLEQHYKTYLKKNKYGA